MFEYLRMKSNLPFLHRKSCFASKRFLTYFICISFVGSGCSHVVATNNPNMTQIPAFRISPSPVMTPTRETPDSSRGYLTTLHELRVISQKAEQGKEPYKSAVDNVIQWANKDWTFQLRTEETCANANDPAWDDNTGGTPILYAKALAYGLTLDNKYAIDVKNILESIMTQVHSISSSDEQCQLNFSWGTPELVASADLINGFWKDQTCNGPVSTNYFNTNSGVGNCKFLFQNWLVKNPYYIISLAAERRQNNWAAAATNSLAYIADYLWDRPDAVLLSRLPPEVGDAKFVTYTPKQAFIHANKLALDRLDGYGVDYGNISCDYLSGSIQQQDVEPVKSQITENGIVSADARRQEFCNISVYGGKYENYPQLYLGNTIQQCELMLRRGDPSCFDNVVTTDLPQYAFNGPDGKPRITHLHAGRGSIERAIKAIIVDSHTEWRHDSALEVAYRYYFVHHTLPGFEQWAPQLAGDHESCDQDICFGDLTAGFSSASEIPDSPFVVMPP
jgi:hypothetical protein